MKVIKYGGNAIADNTSIDNFAQKVAKLWEVDKSLVIIHGGGPQINYWLDKAGIKSEFIKGMRFTSPEVLEVVEMALCANVNKALVRAFLKLGVKAVGISGQDGELLKAEQRADLGLVGDIRAVNPSLIKDLLKQGFLPIVAPLGLSPEFSPLNINADYAAAHIAGALEAQSCIFMTNVDGVLDKNKNLIKSATKAEIDVLIADGTISGGMLPKVDCCLKALELGVREVKIVNANSNKLNGTRIRQFEKQLFYVDLANFEPTGNTRHYKNSGLLPKPVALEIIQYPDPDSSNGYYLFYLDETGFEQTDTYHDTIEQAFAQAEFEFNVKPSDWTKID